MTADIHKPGRDSSDAAAHRLALTEPAHYQADTISEELIRVLVTSFYDVVRHDDLIGPIFTQRVTDWPCHLAKMCDFWSTIVLRSGRYSGRPLEVHAQIPNLRSEQFNRWLELWHATIEQHAPAQVQHRFTDPAVRMARNMARHGDHQAALQRSMQL